ncbi:uncharacterized protein LOC126973031 [Leptidea sinapis]|uniref:uncharacterized protein LOC126973031 n=1 Tax=Leptidea sinapis TaxID=189913 RepID=UPI00213BDC09|nr:uncharacterized protein LOC126973031 [Leptidea sinapis]
MLLKIQWHFLLLSTLQITSAEHKIIVKLDPEVIIKSLISESSLKYLQKFADVFAEKVAQRLIGGVMDKDREHMNYQDKEKQSANQSNDKAIHRITLNEEEALTLLEKPSPDGDNLNINTSFEVSKEEGKSKKNIPVYSLMKVNGKYVRRFLGLI